MNSIKENLNFTDLFPKRISYPKLNVCDLLGHQWEINDSILLRKSEKFKKSLIAERKCIRCKKQFYFFDKWKKAETNDV
jgi:hypothetical protein